MSPKSGRQVPAPEGEIPAIQSPSKTNTELLTTMKNTMMCIVCISHRKLTAIVNLYECIYITK